MPWSLGQTGDSMVKLIYGPNGSGKTKHKNNKSRDGFRVVTSSFNDWYDAIDFPFKKVTISENKRNISRIVGEISTLKDEVAKANSGILWGDGITVTKIKDLIKTVLASEEANTSAFWQNVIQENNLINGDVLSIFLEYDRFKTIINGLEDETLEKIEIYLTIKKNLIKSYKSVTLTDAIAINYNNVVTGLNEILGEFSEEVRMLLNSISDWQTINTIKNNTAAQAYNDALMAVKSKIINSHFREQFWNLFTIKERLLNNRIVFNIPQDKIEEYNALFSTQIIFGDNNKEMVISSSEGLSSGQLTTLISIILVDQTQNLIIFDDVFETLDDKNTFILSEKIINSAFEHEILTHSSDVAGKFIDVCNLIKGEEELTNSIQLITIINDDVFSTSVKSWKYILNQTRGVNHGDGANYIFVRSLIKIFTREIAKTSSIHSSIPDVDSATIKGKDNFKHFHASEWFFHYSPSIDFDTLNQYFSWISLTANISTLELIDRIITEINGYIATIGITFDMIPGRSIFIDFDKMLSYFRLLKDEIMIEKDLLDRGIAVLVPGLRAYEIYRDARIADAANPAVRPRKSYEIHQIDWSPSQITV